MAFEVRVPAVGESVQKVKFINGTKTRVITSTTRSSSS